MDGTEMNYDVLDQLWQPNEPGSYELAVNTQYYNNEILLNDIPDYLKRYNFVCKIDCTKTSSSWKGKGWYRFKKPAGSKMTETTSTEPR